MERRRLTPDTGSTELLEGIVHNVNKGGAAIVCVCLHASVCVCLCLSPEGAAVVPSLVGGRWQQHQCVSVSDQRVAAEEEDSVGMCPIRRDEQRQTVSDGSEVKGHGCIGSDKHAGHIPEGDGCLTNYAQHS